MSHLPQCDVCHKPVNINKTHVYFYKLNKDGTRQKYKTYEHSACSDINQTPNETKED